MKDGLTPERYLEELWAEDPEPTEEGMLLQSQVGISCNAFGLHTLWLIGNVQSVCKRYNWHQTCCKPPRQVCIHSVGAQARKVSYDVPGSSPGWRNHINFAQRASGFQVPECTAREKSCQRCEGQAAAL